MSVRPLYNLFIRMLLFAMHFSAFFHPKARLWVKGRKGWRKRLKQEMAVKYRKEDATVWMHAASLGEFEQGRPILEAIRKELPGVNIILSFFSPSGYEYARNYRVADIICYLPADTPQAAREFVSLIRPDLVLWMKYEYWWNHLREIEENGIPTLLVSAIFQKRQPFFKWYGKWYRNLLTGFSHFFVQDDYSRQLIGDFIPPEKVTVSGDTRFDRVMEIATNWTPVPFVNEWLNGAEKVVVAGSTWPDDEKMLKHLIEADNSIKWILAPHHVDTASIKDLTGRMKQYLLYSQLSEQMPSSPEGNLLIIDCIGLLSRLYKYGSLCYIGGGFSATGIHNVLEAAVYGRPVIFGPEYEEYAEATGLVEAGSAFSVANALELEKTIQLLMQDQELKDKACNISASFVMEKAGATHTILNFIYKNRLLTRL